MKGLLIILALLVCKVYCEGEELKGLNLKQTTPAPSIFDRLISAAVDSKKPGYVWNELQYRYCFEYLCNPWKDCSVFEFCKYVRLQLEQLEAKEEGEPSDYTIPLHQ